MNLNPDALARRLKRLESELGSFSSESDKIVRNIEKVVAELSVRVANLESANGNQSIHRM